MNDPRDMQQLDMEQRQYELEHIYDKIVKRNRHTYQYEWFSEDDLALIRYAFGIDRPDKTVV